MALLNSVTDLAMQVYYRVSELWEINANF